MSDAYLIAITGGSGSGKTTLAEALRARLTPARCVILNEDNYYLPRALHTPSVVGWPNEDIERTIDFDDPGSKDMALFRAHVKALKAGQGIEQPDYDFTIHDRTPGLTHRIEARPVVVVEGVHVLADPEDAPLYDLRVFVDTAADLRLARRVRRDVKRGRNTERTLDQYLRFVRAAHARHTEPAKFLCDIVVADEGPDALNTAPESKAVARLVAPVWARLEADAVACE
jgi:uridine kinase